MSRVDELRERIAHAATTGGPSAMLAEAEDLLVELDTVNKMLAYAVTQHDAHIDALWAVVEAFATEEPVEALAGVVAHLGTYGSEVDEDTIALATAHARELADAHDQAAELRIRLGRIINATLGELDIKPGEQR